MNDLSTKKIRNTRSPYKYYSYNLQYSFSQPLFISLKQPRLYNF